MLFGGIGLFLLGMVLFTDALKSFAGQALRDALLRFTGRPWKAFVSGALATVLVQSSSAATVTVIGFVSAGLLTFPQAVGVVIGSSLGTTGTGWIVSMLGLKFSIGLYALPLVGIGSFLKLLAHGRWKSLGLALAGFGLIFVGIDILQEGMRGVSERFNLAQLPSSGLVGHFLVMSIGVAMTVVMQSSSAAVATTLTALHTGAVSFEQAASLVIGAAIGTTITGALAAIGGSVPAKRTALAHVLFNLATGVIAVVLLPGLLLVIRLMQDHLGLDPGAVSLAAFHTFFIALGVLGVLPVVDRFARWIERLLPETGPELTRHLDDSLLHAPAVALEASRRALCNTACELFRVVDANLGRHPYQLERQVFRITEALERTQQFFNRIPALSEEQPLSAVRVAQMHAIDHLLRLTFHRHQPVEMRRVLHLDSVRESVRLAEELLELGRSGLLGEQEQGWTMAVERKAMTLAELRRQERPLVLSQTADKHRDPAMALQMLDAMRWLDRIGYHAWRICHYLGQGESGIQPSDREMALEDSTPISV